MAKKLTWTDKTREVALLLQEGTEFMEVVAKGYTKNMVHRVKAALDAGQKPTEPSEDDGGNGVKPDGSTSSKPLMSIKTPTKGSPISFRVGTDEILLDPIELYRCYSYYRDISKSDGVTNTFSECITYGMQLVWFMTKDIPLTENMLRAVLYGYQ